MKKITVVSSVNLILFLTIFSSFSYAQEKAAPYPTENWGEEQDFQARQAYWHAIEMSGPDTNIVEARERGYKQFISIPRPKGMMIQSSPAWEQVGGAQAPVTTKAGGIAAQGTPSVSGRPTCIDFDQKNHQVVYMGTSGGGLWKSTDAGYTWVSLSNTWTTYAMGGVAVDQTDGNIIYAGTGDLYDRPGDGLYKSTDAGLNWVHIATDKLVGSRINQVLIDPQVNTTIYATGSDGVRKSADGGVTWKKILSISGNTHMVIDPTNGQNLYAAGGGVIKKSTDGGATWSSKDLASNIAGKSTITLGISKKDVSKIYASIGNGNSQGSVGIARSDDSGSTWKLVWHGDNYLGQQAFYDNALAVNPNNANNVIVGGLDIWGSTNGGVSATQLTDWREVSTASNYSHADVHVLQYGPQGLWTLTDGGVFLSNDNGNTWDFNRNGQLSDMLFVGGDAAPDFSYILGGAQDNGVNLAADGDKVFGQTQGGDGGRSFISQSDGQTCYSTYVYAVLLKSPILGLGQSWVNMIDPGKGDDSQLLINESTPFYMSYDVCESDGAVVAICGNSNLYYSSDGLNTITKITKSALGPHCVHIAGADPTVLYVGTGGYAYVTQDMGDTWVKSTTKIGTPAEFVTDPKDAGKAWAAISGFGAKHFYLTTDFGKTWTAPETNLPDLEGTSIARAPNGDLFIGTTFGVLRSLDNGVTWQPLTDGIPPCQITKLRVRGTSSQYLLATTYGHGMYRININDLPREGVTKTATTGVTPAITSITPNPVQANGKAAIHFTLPKVGEVEIILYDELGKSIKTLLKEYRSQGEQAADVDLSGLASGVYYAVLTSDGHAVTQKMVIAK